jgi:hypothetical protein
MLIQNSGYVNFIPAIFSHSVILAGIIRRRKFDPRDFVHVGGIYSLLAHLVSFTPHLL